VVLERARFAFLTKLLLVVRSRLRSQARLQAEIPVVRQQVLILSCKFIQLRLVRSGRRATWSDSATRFVVNVAITVRG
jgi:hypothetical protein